MPEVEITARLLDRALAGAEIESVHGARHQCAEDVRSAALARSLVSESRPFADAASTLIVETGGDFALLTHLMSAGRLQLYDKRAGPRDRTSRLLVRLTDGRELRLREFGSKQAAWVKLLPASELEQDDALATLGPEAWPDPPPLADVLDAPRPLHTLLRDQRTIAGIGRSWVDEILWRAKLSPFKRGNDLDEGERARLRDAIVSTLTDALAHYEQNVTLPVPDKLPMPLEVHRHEGEPCPSCGETLKSVHFEDYVIAYCPACQTDGRVLKDRRLSRLLR